MKPSSSVAAVLDGIEQLPAAWHKVGSLSMAVLRRMAFHLEGIDVRCSAETGSGKSTLLFSRVSRDHVVFAINDYDGFDTASISNVRNSPLLDASHVRFVEGASQLTLPQYRFASKLQAVLIDGPHGYPFPQLEYYYFYPHLDSGGLLVVDDIHIPTIRQLFDFLAEDEMFSLIETVETTAFFRRTDAPAFSPVLDGWWLQNYNKRRFPQALPATGLRGLARRFRALAPFVPATLRSALRRWLARG